MGGCYIPGRGLGWPSRAVQASECSVTPLCTCKVGMGGPVSSLGEEVWKDSTADGGQGDEQEWWEVKVLRRRPTNSRKFELWLFYIFNFHFTDFIFYFKDFILQFLFYRFYFTLQISFSILQTLFYSFLIFYFTGFIFILQILFCSFYFTDFILLYRFHFPLYRLYFTRF